MGPGCQAGRQKKKKRSKEDLDPAVRLDRDPHVESLVQMMIMSKEGKGSQGQKKMRVEARVNKTRPRPLSKTETVDSVTLVTPSSSNAAGDCVICRHPAVLVTLQQNELDTFVSFVQQFQFQHKFNNALFRNGQRKYPDDDDVLRRSCTGCAESVKIIWHLSMAIESMRLQVRNTISILVENVKVVDDDDDGSTRNPETAEVTSHCHVTQPPEDAVVKKKPESESMCQMGLIGEDAVEVVVKTESDADDDDAGVVTVTFVNSPAFDSLELDLDDIEITPENPERNLVSEEVEGTEGSEEALNGEFHTHRRTNKAKNERSDKRNPDFVELEFDNEGDDDFELDSDSAALSETDSRISSTIKRTTRKRKKVKRMSAKKKILKKCKDCGDQFSSLASLRQHLRDVHHHQKQNRCPCPHCDRLSSSSVKLKAHIRDMHRDKLSEAEVKEFKCSACGMDFHFVKNRMVHEINECKVPYDEERLKEANVKLLRCNEDGCSMVFLNYETIRKHLRSHGVQYNVPNTSETLKNNVAVPDCEKPSKTCSDCGMAFQSVVMRIAHEIQMCRVPYDEDQVKQQLEGHKACLQKCSFSGCELIFGKPSDLARHIRTHTGELPFPCRYCDKSFGQGSSRKLHELSVCQPDPSFIAMMAKRRAECRQKKKLNTLSCPHQDCGKKFMNQTRLDFHLQRFHSGEATTINGTERTNWICDICGKTFTCHTSLIMHTKRVHERQETDFPCLLRIKPRCQERFTSREERIQHVLVVHGRKYKDTRKAHVSN